MTILFLSLIMASPVHDIKMAIFEISEGKSGLEMTVSIDKEDFLATLSHEFELEVTSQNLEALAFYYLDEKVSIKINGECTSFAIQEIAFGDLNIYLKGNLNRHQGEVKEVRISNTCMVDLFKNHDNIMKLKLHDRMRSFRLNSKRTSTIASY